MTEEEREIEAAKANNDAMIFGTGVLRDGKHVPLSDWQNSKGILLEAMRNAQPNEIVRPDWGNAPVWRQESDGRVVLEPKRR